MVVKTDYGIMFIRPENPADDKTAIAIGRGLRQWASNSSSSAANPTPSARNDPSSSDEPQNP